MKETRQWIKYLGRQVFFVGQCAVKCFSDKISHIIKRKENLNTF